MENILISNKAKLPTKFGNFLIKAFKENCREHLVIYTEDLTSKIPLVRVHSECLTGDALGSLKCDCGDQLKLSLKMINEYGCGMVIYLRQEGRDIGLLNKVNAYALQDLGLDTIEANHQLGFDADERTYEIAEFIFSYFNINSIDLLTNNPNKIESLPNIKINRRVPLIIKANEYNKDYLRVKKEKAGHFL